MFAPISQEPRARGARTLNNSKCQDWEKLYRAALLESDRSKLLQRIENAEAAILERSRSLSKSPGNHEKEQGVITRALHILSLLREPGQKQELHAIAAGCPRSRGFRDLGFHRGCPTHSRPLRMCGCAHHHTFVVSRTSSALAETLTVASDYSKNKPHFSGPSVSRGHGDLTGEI